MKKLFLFPLAALALAACSDDPAGMLVTDPAAAREIVITPGIPAPTPTAKPGGPLFSKIEAKAVLAGSRTISLNLKANECDGSSQTVLVNYRVDGEQSSTSTFTVDTRWVYENGTWNGSVPVTTTVPPRTNREAAADFPIEITVENGSAVNSGSSTFYISPSVSTSGLHPLDAPQGQSRVRVDVEFNGCTVSNTAPSLNIPGNITEEATSSAGATVNFTVSASDAQDGDLTSEVQCSHASGGTFPIGATEVTCSVKDSGGLEADGSFWVYVQDTTAPVFTAIPSGTIERVATNINGWLFDQASFGITAEDKGPDGEPGDVSGEVTVVCTAQESLAIGSIVQVDCIASDAASYRAPGVDMTAPNSRAESFEVLVTLDRADVAGFLPPLRMNAPYSAHKLNSTVPHKFPAPKYADGTLATDLAEGLNLTLTKLDNTPGDSPLEVNEFSAGSTAWRYDAESGHYIFNMKTSTKTPWTPGTWQTTVSYRLYTIATTPLDLRK